MMTMFFCFTKNSLTINTVHPFQYGFILDKIPIASERYVGVRISSELSDRHLPGVAGLSYKPISASLERKIRRWGSVLFRYGDWGGVCVFLEGSTFERHRAANDCETNIGLTENHRVPMTDKHAPTKPHPDLRTITLFTIAHTVHGAHSKAPTSRCSTAKRERERESKRSERFNSPVSWSILLESPQKNLVFSQVWKRLGIYLDTHRPAIASRYRSRLSSGFVPKIGHPMRQADALWCLLLANPTLAPTNHVR